MLIRGGRLASDPDQMVDIRVSGELVTEIAPFLAQQNNEEVHDARGGLVTESLVEPHAHLDKAYLSERITNPTGDLMGAINAMRSSRSLITVADTIVRAERAVRTMVSYGVTTIRTHADVTFENGLDSVEALLEVRERVRNIVDIQIVALLGWPMTGSEGVQHVALAHAARKLGIDLVGGCPHLEKDSTAANILLIELAGELACGLDLHTDEHTDATRISLDDLAQRVIATGFEHPVTASHCVSLGMLAHERQRKVAEQVAEARIGVVALPHTNLFLQGRDMQSAMPRGLTAVAALLEAGVHVAAGGDNLQDPFNPIGKGDPLESAGLMILCAHLLPNAAFASVSSAGRQVLGLPVAGPCVGAVADLMITSARTIREAIASGAPRSLVMRRGVVTHAPSSF